MKEIGRGGLQDKIITSVMAQGGRAEKTNGAFKKGIADLIIKYDGFPIVLAEVKYHGKRCSTDLFKTKLEPLQRKFQKDFGSVTLTGVIYKGELRLYLTTDPAEMISINHTPFTHYENGVFQLRTILDVYT